MVELVKDIIGDWFIVFYPRQYFSLLIKMFAYYPYVEW